MLKAVYASLLSDIVIEVEEINNPKHKIDQTQELDKAIHLADKAIEILEGINKYLSAFGKAEE